MPFVISKGKDPSKTFRHRNEEVKKSDGSCLYLSPFEEMEEIINFKLYHIKHIPADNDAKKKISQKDIRLVGEDILRRTGNDTTIDNIFGSKTENVVEVKGPSLLRDILMEKSRKVPLYEKIDFACQNVKGFKKLKQIKAGISLGNDTVEISPLEAISFLVKYVAFHEGNLDSILFDVNDQAQLLIASQGQDTTTNTLFSISDSGKKTEEKTSVEVSPQKKSEEANMTKKEGKNGYKRGNRVHQLTTKLEKIESDNREKFLASITLSAPNSPRLFDGKTREFFAEEAASAVPETNNQPGMNPSAALHAPSPPTLTPRKSDNGVRHRRLLQSLNNGSSLMEDSFSSSLSISQPSTFDTIEPSLCISVAEDDSDDISLFASKINSITTSLPVPADSHTPTNSCPITAPSSPKNRPTSPIRYTNDNTLEFGTASECEIPETTMKKYLQIAKMEKTIEESFAGLDKEIDRKHGCILNLEQTGKNMLKETDRVGGKMLHHWSSFNQECAFQQRNMANIFLEKDFKKPKYLMSFMKIWQMEENEAEKNRKINTSKNKGKSILELLHSYEKEAVLAHKSMLLSNLASNSWFVVHVTKFKDHLHRTNHETPENCFKFLVVVQSLLMEGYKLTEDVFYATVEATLTVSEEYSRSDVNSAIKVVRESIGIGPRKFLKYLEKKSIEPCPDLLIQLRSYRRNKINTSFRGSFQRDRSTNTMSISMMSGSSKQIVFAADEDGNMNEVEDY